MSSNANAIEVTGVSKQFKHVQALRDVSFTIPKQSLFCILGPNGAGKTTLLRILNTIARPTKGQVRIDGLDIAGHSVAIREQIGIVAQENHFDQYLSIWHNLTLHAQMHGMAPREFEPRITELLKTVGMYDRRNSLAGELSGGMQRRIALIRALIHRPRILFLDEPTTGLDPEARLSIWKTIEALKKDTTVILTTHYMEEADRLSDCILLLYQGQVVKIGTPEELKMTVSPRNTFELVFKSPQATELALSHLQNLVAQHQINGHIVNLAKENDHALHIQVDSVAGFQQVVCHMDLSDLYRMGQVEGDLEDVFMAIPGLMQNREGAR